MLRIYLVLQTCSPQLRCTNGDSGCPIPSAHPIRAVDRGMVAVPAMRRCTGYSWARPPSDRAAQVARQLWPRRHGATTSGRHWALKGPPMPAPGKRSGVAARAARGLTEVDSRWPRQPAWAACRTASYVVPACNLLEASHGAISWLASRPREGARQAGVGRAQRPFRGPHRSRRPAVLIRWRRAHRGGPSAVG